MHVLDRFEVWWLQFKDKHDRVTLLAEGKNAQAVWLTVALTGIALVLELSWASSLSLWIENGLLRAVLGWGGFVAVAMVGLVAVEGVAVKVGYAPRRGVQND